MSRLVALKLVWHGGIEREIDSALNAIIANDAVERFHLCCGLSGSSMLDMLIHDCATANVPRDVDQKSIHDFYDNAVASMFDTFVSRREELR